MLLTPQQISGTLDDIAESVSRASESFDRANNGPDDGYSDWSECNVAWRLELAYAQLLTLAEALGLPLLRSDIAQDLAAAKAEGFSALEHDPGGDPHLKWQFPVRRHIHTIQTVFANEPSRTVTKDLESILRAAAYSITDRKVFGEPPQDEASLHLRLEAVLKCVFTDLKHKPSITKPIKNFEPDTGIASIRTLIEYKYLSSEVAVSRIADELLADTRGYISPEWSSFVYVIYETQRFKPESEWRHMLREAGVGGNTLVIVISGEPREKNALAAAGVAPTKQHSP